MTRDEFETLLRAQEHASVEPLEANAWLVSMEGKVRQRVNVATVLRPDRVSFYFFMVRAPRENHEAFYRALLRKNLRSFAMKYCLDPDGDVWLVAELPVSGFDGGELDRILGVFYQESESAFEALVHLGYPGVFPPLFATPRGPMPLPTEPGPN
ncbi:MAG: YbjN domain-containing protein [Candidatus Dormibacteraeota bacterium]|nr:YbjN domain-containing protein [Candidatus Dormibacteraeota bacterium]